MNDLCVGKCGLRLEGMSLSRLRSWLCMWMLRFCICGFMFVNDMVMCLLVFVKDFIEIDLVVVLNIIVLVLFCLVSVIVVVIVV